MGSSFPRPFGKYYLLAPLAQGGMGALYLAATGDREMQKLCVIKTVLPHLADAEYVARFRDEAKVVVRLSHGNLVPVFDAGQVDGQMFLVMEFVEGKDLRAVWNRCAKKGIAFPIDIAVYIIKELARGLAFAHGFGGLKLVHRDVSPPNILVGYSGEVKLTDFGLATSTLKLEKTAPGVIYGKVSYMSPEQARGEPLDGRTDIYASGIILWEMLTGRQLFPPGEHQPADLIARCRNPKVDEPSVRAPRVPRSLDPIVLRALAANNAERYQQAEEFRADLAGYLAREAPATDAARVASFLRDLFAEDIDQERRDREELLAEAADMIHGEPPAGGGGAQATAPRIHKAIAAAAAPPPPGGRTAPAPWGGAAAQSESPTPRDVGPPSPPAAAARPRVPAPQADGSTVITGGSGGVALAMTAEEAPRGDPVLGTVVDGRYRVSSLIGEGGMGRVYAAEHTEIGKRVALKILHPVYSRMPEVVERFRREARAASKIGHPNIVDVTDSGTTGDGSVFFVMEYLEGVELAEVINREGALPVERSVSITVQICRALAAAHAAGIIHRDLKPENVFLVARDGTTDFVKVLDFGIAKSAELEETRAARLTSPGMAMGTPEYMAPEQAAGKSADARADIYATGAIFYEMLTGVAPFDGENFMEILTKKATQEPRPPRALRPEIPAEIEALVLRCMARNPDDRPQSMEAFEYEITKCLAGRGAAVAKMLGMPIDASALGMDPPASSEGGFGRGASTAAAGISGSALGLRSPRARLAAIAAAAVAVAGAAALVWAVAFRGAHGPDTATPAPAVVAPTGMSAPPPRSPAPGVQAAPQAVQQAAPPALPSPPAVEPATPQGLRGHAGKVSAHERTASRAERLRDETKARLEDCNKDIALLRFHEADGCFRTVLSSSPYSHAAAYYGLAEAAFNDGRMGDAVRYARSALGNGGGDEARVLLGDAYLRQGKTADAVKMYETALAHNPQNQRARAGLHAAQQR